MALTSSFYDGVVTESDRAKNLAGSPEYGVYGPEDFKVTAHPSIPYAVLVKAGRAHGRGVTDTAAEDQVVQCAPLASGVRWDLIVIRRNWQPELGGPSTLEVIEAGAEPQIPAGRIVGPGVEDDQPIFLVKWQGGVSAPVDFRDLRVWAGNGGLYAKDELVRTYLTTVGTKVKINGENWSYEILANNLPGWVNEDGSGPWVNLTYMPGWQNVGGGSTPRARLVGRGAFVHVQVESWYPPGQPVEGWIICKLPGGMQPKESTMIPGTTNGYRSAGVYTVLGENVRVGPFPVGNVVQCNGIVPLK